MQAGFDGDRVVADVDHAIRHVHIVATVWVHAVRISVITRSEHAQVRGANAATKDWVEGPHNRRSGSEDHSWGLERSCDWEEGR